MKNKFWIIWNELSTRPPTFKHDSLAAANDEAERLARVHGGTFHVMEVVASCTKNDVSWTQYGEESGPRGHELKAMPMDPQAIMDKASGYIRERYQLVPNSDADDEDTSGGWEMPSPRPAGAPVPQRGTVPQRHMPRTREQVQAQRDAQSAQYRNSPDYDDSDPFADE